MCSCTFTKLVTIFVIFSATCVKTNALNDENDLRLTLDEHNTLEEVYILQINK